MGALDDRELMNVRAIDAMLPHSIRSYWEAPGPLEVGDAFITLHVVAISCLLPRCINHLTSPVIVSIPGEFV